MPTTITILVGKIGSGKTTWLAWKAGQTHQSMPGFPQVSNVPIHSKDKSWAVHYEEDIFKWLALKLNLGDKTPCEVYIDEAAQSGLESRGSGLKSTDSRIITLARKANIHLFIATQMMSMIDKRLQWNWDFALDCSPHYVTEEYMDKRLPDYFSYDVYDSSYKFQYTMDLHTFYAETELFETFDTMEVPMRSLLEAEFKAYYWGNGLRGVQKGVDNKAYDEDVARFAEFKSKINPAYLEGEKT